MIRKISRNTPPAPIPRGRNPCAWSCRYSINLTTPHRMISAGQYFPNQNNSAFSDTRWLVESSATMPMSISTIGPASDLRRLLSGICPGLAMSYLVGGRRWRDHRVGRARPCGGGNVLPFRAGTLQNLDYAYH